MWEWRYCSTILGFGSSRRLQSTGHFDPGEKDPDIHKAGWAPELVQILWRTEKSVASAGNRTPTAWPSSLSSSLY